MNPRVSVIVPIYNTSKYLRQCLDTVINQTLHDIEIICVNDGSMDDSETILEEFASKDNRIIILKREHASGSAAVPRNMGLDIARGRYVMFLDSDDYFDETMLEKLVKRAEKTSADLVLCDNYVVSASTGEINGGSTELHAKYLPEQEVFSYKTIPETIFQITNTGVWNMLILRGTLERHHLRFQPDVPILDDIYFVDLALVLSERISIARERLVFYRVSRYGAQTTKIEQHMDSVYLSFKALNDYLTEHSLYHAVKFSLQNWTLATMSWWLYSIGSYDKFCELFARYKNEYLEKLGLLDIAPECLYDGLRRFYNGILGREPSLIEVLESVLKPGSAIVIYGAGFVGHHIYTLIKNQGKHRIKLWCDKNAERIANPLVNHPEELCLCDFDALFVAIGNEDMVNEVRKYLINMGVDARKIYLV